MPSYWLIIFSVVGSLASAGIIAAVKRHRLFLVVSKLFPYSGIINKDEILVEIVVVNLGLKQEEDIEIIFSKHNTYEHIASTDKDTELRKDTIFIRRLPSSESISSIVLVKNKDLTSNDIIKFTSKLAKGKVVTQYESLATTKSLIILTILFVITASYMVSTFHDIFTDDNSTSGDFLEFNLPPDESLKNMNTQFQSIVKRSGCTACHYTDRKVVGPSWIDIARKYRNTPDAGKYLTRKIKNGSKGVWTEITGGVPMPPYSPRVPDKDIHFLVNSILSIKDG
jgi:cytochrome c